LIRVGPCPTTTTRIPYCSHEPTPRQAEFLERQELEVFFGGAAGGGKSVALLMAALEHVDQPGYAALILRKDLPRLGLPGGLIPRSHEWLAGTNAIWNQARRQWQFPNDNGPPATITFGFLARPLDKYRYASSEFQFIAFDELTDFEEEDYLFLFSRLRRVKTLDVPLRMRSASNPGGTGHLWVKQRFVEPSPEQSNNRAYIPSRIADNPYLNESEYRQTLLHLPTVVRERLMNGDWDIQENAMFKTEWLRYYTELNGQLELLEPPGRLFATIDVTRCRRFVTIDPAGTSADRTNEAHGRGACWSVLQVWDQPTNELHRFLILRHQVRERFGFDGLLRAIHDVNNEWKPWQIFIEGEKLGQATVDQLQRELPISCIPPGTNDKPTRAIKLVVKMERGEIFFPKHNATWRPQLEAEMLSWTGAKHQPADQIDAAAYAAIVAGDAVGSAIKLRLPLAIQ
jgi:predicted phage terminase large subunit-like protein